MKADGISTEKSSNRRKERQRNTQVDVFSVSMCRKVLFSVSIGSQSLAELYLGEREEGREVVRQEKQCLC